MDNKFEGKYRTSTVRAKWWDYSSNASYFITICTKDRIHSFGEIIDGNMKLTILGSSVIQCWNAIPNFYPFIVLDAFVVMPNHIHGVLHFNKSEEQSIDYNFENKESKVFSGSLGAIVRGFKVGVKKEANKMNVVFSWQPSYHEHIIRNVNTYNKIIDYIYKNPLLWQKDKFYNE